MKKGIEKITKGTLKSEGTVWFLELSDKGVEQNGDCNIVNVYLSPKTLTWYMEIPFLHKEKRERVPPFTRVVKCM